jgi:hypothetical protein
MALQAELALDSMAQQNIVERAAIRGIVASFQQTPTIGLLARNPIQRPGSGASDSALGRSRNSAGVAHPDEAAAHLSSSQNAQKSTSSGLDVQPPGGAYSIPSAREAFSSTERTIGMRRLRPHRHRKPSDQPDSAVCRGASKLVDVTGLLVAAVHRPQVEFIVGNHSATALSDIGLQMAVSPRSPLLALHPCSAPRPPSFRSAPCS